MTRFYLPKNHFIKQLDKYNWALIVIKTRKEDGEKYEVTDGYTPTLKGAWNMAVDKLALKASCNEELHEVLDKMEKLKFNI